MSVDADNVGCYIGNDNEDGGGVAVAIRTWRSIKMLFFCCLFVVIFSVFCLFIYFIEFLFYLFEICFFFKYFFVC